MASTFGAVDLAHDFISRFVKEGDRCIDATAGRGFDTEFMCGLVGESGKVYSFDIQADAIESTRKLLMKNGHEERAILINDGHEKMDAYVTEPVKCAVFNFGWLPSGNHNICTRKNTSLEAVEKALGLLQEGGIMSLSIYYGRENGFDEKDAILEYVKGLDLKLYTVIVSEFYNRPNCPPISVYIIKQENL